MRPTSTTQSTGANGRISSLHSNAFFQTIKLAAAACLLLATVCSVTCITLTTQGPMIRTLAADSRDTRTDHWFQAEAEKLFGELFGKSQPDRIVFAHGSSRLRDGRRVETVTVDCEDRGGRQMLSLLWNANSHELISLVRAYSESNTRRETCLSQVQAVTLAREWVQAIGMGDRLDHWSELRPPRLDGDRWDIRLVSGHRTAYVAIDARSRSLISARLAG